MSQRLTPLYAFIVGINQSWAEAKVFASSRPRRESILTTRRRTTAENNAIAKDAMSLRRKISHHWVH